MKITLTEALRVKNELSKIITDTQYKVRYSEFGSTSENGSIISGDNQHFPELELTLVKALNLSQTINNTISDFNKESGVDKLVRALQNDKLFLKLYTDNLEKFKAKSSTKFQNLTASREEIKVVYEPYVSLTTAKARISEFKTKIRNNQNKIEALNTTVIDLPFEYSDVEGLL